MSDIKISTKLFTVFLLDDLVGKASPVKTGGSCYEAVKPKLLFVIRSLGIFQQLFRTLVYIIQQVVYGWEEVFKYDWNH